MKPVHVTWIDATSDDEWIDKADWKNIHPHTIETFGWLVEELETHVIICTSFDQEREAIAGRWAIPKSWLMQMREIKSDETL